MAKRKTELQQVSSLATVTAMAMRGGLSGISALEVAVDGAKGSVAEELRVILARIDLGEPSHIALGVKHDGALGEFLTKLQTSNQLGSSLADQLDEFVESLREKQANELLTSAVASETRMLLPLVFLILPISVLFALYPSLQILNLQLEGI